MGITHKHSGISRRLVGVTHKGSGISRRLMGITHKGSGISRRLMGITHGCYGPEAWLIPAENRSPSTPRASQLSVIET